MLSVLVLYLLCHYLLKVMTEETNANKDIEVDTLPDGIKVVQFKKGEGEPIESVLVKSKNDKNSKNKESGDSSEPENDENNKKNGDEEIDENIIDEQSNFYDKNENIIKDEDTESDENKNNKTSKIDEKGDQKITGKKLIIEIKKLKKKLNKTLVELADIKKNLFNDQKIEGRAKKLRTKGKIEKGKSNGIEDLYVKKEISKLFDSIKDCDEDKDSTYETSNDV